MIIPAADKMASLPDQLTIKHLIPLTLPHDPNPDLRKRSIRTYEYGTH
jgi:hypothetical protein